MKQLINAQHDMKVLIATEKPFASAAAKGIQEILEKAGHDVAKLESYTEKSELLTAVADANALIIRSDKVDAAPLKLPNISGNKLLSEYAAPDHK